MLALFVHVCARIYKIWEMLKRSLKHEPGADSVRVDSLACKPSVCFFSSRRSVFDSHSLNGFANVQRMGEVAKKMFPASSEVGKRP